MIMQEQYIHLKTTNSIMYSWSQELDVINKPQEKGCVLTKQMIKSSPNILTSCPKLIKEEKQMFTLFNLDYGLIDLSTNKKLLKSSRET